MSSTAIPATTTTINNNSTTEEVELVVYWDGGLVVLSIILAMVGSYVAIGLLQSRNSKLLLVLAAFTESVAAIFSLHFIGQLSAFNIDGPMHNDVGLSVGSPFFAFFPILGGFLLLDHYFPPSLTEDENTWDGNIKALKDAPWLLLIASALCLAAGIGGMHFAAMGGFSTPGGRIEMNIALIVVCIILAAVVSLVALVLAFVLPVSRTFVAPTAVVFGIAIAVVHYTNHAFGMRFFLPQNLIEDRKSHWPDQYYAAVWVAVGSLLISFIAYSIHQSLSKNAAAPDPAGRVAIVVTDVQASSRMWKRQPKKMQEALRIHDRILHRAIKRARGFIFKSAGDSFMVALHNARDAVMLASSIQRDLFKCQEWPDEIDREYGMNPTSVTTTPPQTPKTKENANAFASSTKSANDGSTPATVDIPSGGVSTHDSFVLDTNSRPAAGGACWHGLRVRVGVHLSGVGAVELREDPTTGKLDCFGDPVNMCSRVCDAAHGGQIVVTQSVMDALSVEDIRETFKFDVESLGAHDLKGIDGAQVLVQMVPHEFGTGAIANSVEPRTFPSLRTEANKTADILAGYHMDEASSNKNIETTSSNKESLATKRGGGAHQRMSSSNNSRTGGFGPSRGNTGVLAVGNDFSSNRSSLDNLYDLHSRNNSQSKFSFPEKSNSDNSNITIDFRLVEAINQDSSSSHHPQQLSIAQIEAVLKAQTQLLKTVINTTHARPSSRMAAVEDLCEHFNETVPLNGTQDEADDCLGAVAGHLATSVIKAINSAALGGGNNSNNSEGSSPATSTANIQGGLEAGPMTGDAERSTLKGANETRCPDEGEGTTSEMSSEAIEMPGAVAEKKSEPLGMTSFNSDG